jgi:hypothetical protein
MLNEAGPVGEIFQIDIGLREFLSCDFNPLFGTAFGETASSSLSQFLRV